MSKSYQIKQTEINDRGHKVVTTVSTDDPAVAKALIGSATSTESTASGKKSSKASTTKSTSKKGKKGVVIDAEFTEVKKTKKSSTKPKALPAPAAKKKDSKQKPETKAPTLKAYIYLVKFAVDGINRELSIYAPNKPGADKLVNYFLKINGGNFSLVKYVRTSVAEQHKRNIQRYNLTIDNYYQKQVDVLDASKVKKPSKGSKKETLKASKKPSVESSTSRLNKKPGVCIFQDKTGRFSVYQEAMGFSLYDKNDCVQQLLFETDASKALKVFGEKIKQLAAADKKKYNP